MSLRALLFGLAVSPAALAIAPAPKETEVTICDRGRPAVAKRLRSELELMGVRVHVGIDGKCLDDAPTERAAIVVTSPDRVSIRYSSNERTEELEVAARTSDAPDIVALSTVEILRARLLHPSTEPSAGAMARPDPAEDHRKKAQPMRWAVELGPSLFLPSNPIPAALGLYGQLGLELGYGFVVGLRASASVNRAEFPVDGGTLSYHWYSGTVVGQYRVPFLDGAFELRPTLGLGVARGSSKAIPESKNFLETRTNPWSALGLALLELGWLPMSHCTLLADAGFAAMTPGMVFDGSMRDPSVGGSSSPERKSELGRFGAVLSAGARFDW